MGDTLKGKVAVVTGSGQGVGRAVAIGLAKEGAKVVTNNRKPGGTGNAMMTSQHFKRMDAERSEWYQKEMEEIKGDAEGTAAIIKSMGGEAVPCYADASDFQAAARLIQTAIDNFGRIDILANIAGAFGICPVEEMTEELWDKVTRVKPKGYFNTIRHALPHMIKQKWGRIINTTSRAFNGDLIKHAEYCAANAGVVGLTKAVAIEMAEHNITCNAIGPFAKTRASYELEGLMEASNSDASDVWISGSAAKMLDFTPGPEYIAPFVCYLASDAAAEISGSIFNVAGNNIGMWADFEVAKTVTKFGKEPWTMEELTAGLPMSLFQGYRAPAKNYH